MMKIPRHVLTISCYHCADHTKDSIQRFQSREPMNVLIGKLESLEETMEQEEEVNNGSFSQHFVKVSQKSTKSQQQQQQQLTPPRRLEMTAILKKLHIRMDVLQEDISTIYTGPRPHPPGKVSSKERVKVVSEAIKNLISTLHQFKS